ncbi:Uncharacterized conserved protein [Phaffia rhodozyma]|uniref:Uncharacterized conserved protein n=1 Tax=Phaffia rhodozyma TaxID=264483 RepID=A0A0F7SGQ6_PHARH|nr:Uncharacterized conserved protein [Phaffia rhodozyma]
MSNKILALGPALGSLRAFIEKQRALQSKHHFNLCVCVGDFFGPEGENPDEVDDLLRGSLNVPLTTYIMLGSHALPEKVQAKIIETGGEICTNLFFVGQSNVLNTSEGIKIGAIGGNYDPVLWDAATNSSSEAAESEAAEPTPTSTVNLTPSLLAPVLASPHIFPEANAPSALTGSNLTLASQKAIVPTGLDILLLQTPPPSLSLLSPSFNGLEFNVGQGATPLVEIIRRAKPRYVFFMGGRDGEDGFWEREPFGWDGAGSEGRYTRCIRMGRFGGPPPLDGQKKARSFYAFSLAPLAPPFPVKPANATPNPFALPPSSTGRGTKREAPEGGENFIWGQSGPGGKKARGEGPPPPSYTCRICNEPGHWIQACPRKDAHNAEKQVTQGDGPPANYVCRICKLPGHYIRDCPQKTNNSDSSADRQNSGAVTGIPKRPELSPAECWFCLSNPKVTKHLIVSIGTETYVTLPKGQLPPTASATKMVQNKVTGLPEMPAGSEQPGLVPGGGHVLIIPISHYPTVLSIPKEDAVGIESEIEKTKAALAKCYKVYNSVPVVFEVGRSGGRGGHAHLQIVPVPLTAVSQIESVFREEGAKLGINFESDADVALNSIGTGGRDSYFRVDFPNGKLIHLIRGTGFNLQFGRTVLAKLLEIPHRVDWKACAQTDAEEKADAVAFKKAYAQFDPFK